MGAGVVGAAVGGGGVGALVCGVGGGGVTFVVVTVGVGGTLVVAVDALGSGDRLAEMVGELDVAGASAVG
ncbi:MAG TPA: hypothetical protein VI814_02235 [Candidatus Limnocylindria bacterium]